MSNFEIFLIVGFSIVPLITILFVLPKKLKKDKTPPPTTEYKTEQPPMVEEKKEEPKEIKPNIVANVASTGEFKEYLSKKKDETHLPKHIIPPINMDTEDYLSFRRRNRKLNKENKSISEQIQDLSPELKVMMFSGVFNKKDFDE